MNTVPSFDEFYRAVAAGRDPFPWQSALAEEVVSNGWPDLLDLPTGAGKTSALDIALYCLAVAPERMPRRTVLVVDRRIVVDQASTHLFALLAALGSARSGPAHQVANALRALWNGDAEALPFAVATMRGGMPRDNDWARRPDQPVFGVSTVDQVGSRLLFRGYGLSPRSAPIHAGLLGNDTLILLDEVHLAEPFAQTLDALRTTYRRHVPGLPRRFAVVRMSATAGEHEQDWKVFSLSDRDRNHPVLARRLTARKSASLVSVRVSGAEEAEKLDSLARAAVAQALALARGGAGTVGVVLNRVDSARRARALLEEHASEVDALLVTGRMRPIERDHLVEQTLLPRCGPRDQRAPVVRPLAVVATQCIEAGADLDFDALVTECASLDALRQRFGRLDRAGSVGQTRSVILCRSDQSPIDSIDAVYGGALSATWSWLQSVAVDGAVDFGIDRLRWPENEAGRTRSDVLSPRPDAPVLLRTHLDALAQTWPRSDYEPDVALFLHGPDRQGADVQLVWRAGLTFPQADASAQQASTLLSDAIALLSANRPSSLEAMSVPIGAVRRWLAADAPIAIADVVAARDPDEDDSRGDVPNQPKQLVLRWRGDDSRWATPGEVRPGDVVVVSVGIGGIRCGSFDPGASDAVPDLGVLAALRGRAEVDLRANVDALAGLGLDRELAGALALPSAEETAREWRERVREWAARLPDRLDDASLVRRAEWVAFKSALRGRDAGRLHRLGGATLKLRAERGALRREVDEAVSEDDSSSFVAREVTLSAHSSHVRDHARRFAASVGFSARVADDVTLAAWLHDVGKADARFQRWLLGGSDARTSSLSEPLAKSALDSSSNAEREQARRRSGYPPRYRHELLSLAMIESSQTALSSAHDRDLVLHLVASHHGFCRPFAPFVDDPTDEGVSLEHGGVQLKATTRHRKASPEGGVGERFWRLVDNYGWWGLAWLEAVVRLADHRASAEERGGA